MSLLVIFEPEDVVPVTRPVEFIVQSTNSYIAALQVAAQVNADEVATFTQLPDYDTSKFFTVDVQDILEDNIGFDLHEIGEGGVRPAPNSYVSYDLLLEERLSNNGSQLYAGDDKTTPGPKYALNATLQHTDKQSLNDYSIGVATSYGTNLIVNPNFDNNLAGWTVGANNLGTFSKDTLFQGMNYKYTGTTFTSDTIKQTVQLKANTKYRLAYLYFAAIADAPFSGYYITLSGATRVKGVASGNSGVDPRLIEVIYETGPSPVTSTLEITIVAYSDFSMVWVGDMLLEEVFETFGEKRFLTHAPLKKKVRPGDSEFLPGFALMKSGMHRLHVTKTDKNGTETTKELVVDGLHVLKRFDIGVGPTNINDVIPGFIDDNTKSYSLQVYSNVNDNIFTDGDDGTFESGIGGIQSNGGNDDTGLSHDGKPDGTGMVLALDASILSHNLHGRFTAITSLNVFSVTAGLDYLISADVYVEGTEVPYDMILQIEKAGNSTATITHLSTWDASRGDQLGIWKTISARMSVTSGTFEKIKVTGSSLSLGKFGGTLDTTTILFDNIQVRKDGFQSSSEERTYVLDYNCYEDPTRVHWLNRMGGFDSYTFTGTERKRLKTGSTTFQKYLNNGFSVKDRGVQVQSRTGLEELRCSTDAITVEEMEWLETLLTSPEVYIQKDDQYIPVVIDDGTFEVRNRARGLHRLTIELTYANEVLLQRN